MEGGGNLQLTQGVIAESQVSFIGSVRQPREESQEAIWEVRDGEIDRFPTESLPRSQRAINCAQCLVIRDR